MNDHTIYKDQTGPNTGTASAPAAEDMPIRQFMNSMVNPQGIIPEPISKSIEKSQLAATQQPELKKDGVLNKRFRPEMQGKENETYVGGERQLQSDLKYTSVMKKDKEFKKKDAGKKVASVMQRSDNVLIKLKSVFPFDFFPNTVTIDANKVSIVDKNFFASETITTILLEEITDVVVQSNFFLGQLIITYSHHPLQPITYKIPALKKSEALKAQEIIQGLLVMRISEGIDISKLQPEEITKELARIGRTHENVP